MTPHESRKRQIEKYRLMSGEERLQVGLDLHELACEIARDSIRALLPNASVAEVEEELRLRRRMAYEINTQP